MEEDGSPPAASIAEREKGVFSAEGTDDVAAELCREKDRLEAAVRADRAARTVPDEGEAAGPGLAAAATVADSRPVGTPAVGDPRKLRGVTETLRCPLPLSAVAPLKTTGLPLLTSIAAPGLPSTRDNLLCR